MLPTIYEQTAGKILRLIDPAYDIAHAGHEATEPEDTKTLAELLREAFPAHNIDSDLLREQRDGLQRLQHLLTHDKPEIYQQTQCFEEHLEGLINLCDSLLDDAEGIKLPFVPMPPRSELACGCQHHGVLPQCPIHDTKASPFNIHPEGRPL